MSTTITTADDFLTGSEGDLVCRHRDLSCCAACAAAHPEIVDVYGKHFWIDDDALRAALIADMA